jgi:hypothetical protein
MVAWLPSGFVVGSYSGIEFVAGASEFDGLSQ